MSAVAFQTVKYAGAAYLLYLAWSMWRDTGALQFSPPSNKNGLRQIATKGFLINILNPKLSILFLAFLPLFVSPNALSTAMFKTPLIQLFMCDTVDGEYKYL